MRPFSTSAAQRVQKPECSRFDRGFGNGNTGDYLRHSAEKSSRKWDGIQKGSQDWEKKNCWFYSLFVKDHRNYNPCWWERFGRDWKVSDRGERGKALEQSLHRCRRRLARVPQWGDCLEVRALTLPRLHVEGRQKYGHRCGCDGGMDTACGSSPDCMYFLSEIGSKIWDNHLEEWIV